MGLGSWLSENVFDSHVDTGQADKDIAEYRALNVPYREREQANYNQGQQLYGQLQDTVAGRTPSVAQAQLGQAMGDIQANQTAQASGARGQGAVLARYGAQQGTADAQARMGGNAAVARAKEIEAAQGNMIKVLTQMGMQSTQMYQETLNAYLDAQRRRQALEVQNAAANTQAFTAGAYGGSQAYSAYAGGSSGDSGGGGGGSSASGDGLLAMALA